MNAIDIATLCSLHDRIHLCCSWQKQIGLHQPKLTLWMHVSFMTFSDKRSPLFC